jgi:hypothetical protein
MTRHLFGELRGGYSLIPGDGREVVKEFFERNASFHVLSEDPQRDTSPDEDQLPPANLWVGVDDGLRIGH